MTTPSSEINKLMAMGIAASEENRWEDAKSAFQSVLNKIPDHADAMWRLGMAMFFTGEADPAIDLIELSLGRDTDNAGAHNALGFVFRTQDEFALAESHFRQAAALTPDDADVLFNLGVVLLRRQNFADARQVLEKAKTLAPKDSDIHLNLGAALRKNGEDDEAEIVFRRAIALDGRNGDAYRELAILLWEQDQFSEAYSASINALANDKDNTATQQIHGVILFDLNESQQAVPIFENILKDDPYNLKAILYLGRCQMALGNVDRAIHAFERARDSEPNNAVVFRYLREAYAMMRPAWLTGMIGDSKRNNAYQTAIDRIVTTDDVVLDLGGSTGSGLLPMMAARAGAQKVFTCESSQPISEMTRRIIAVNGFNEKITVLSKPSKFLELKKDLNVPASVIISDILDVTLVGGGVLPVLRYASKYLTQDGCKFIPAGATLFGQLLEWPNERALIPINEMNGFDIGEFDVLRNPYAYHQFHPSYEEHQLLSEPFVLAEIDFAHIPDAPVRSKKTMTASKSGVGHAVAVWFDLHFDEDETFTTTSSLSRNRWYQTAHMLAQVLPVQSGQDFELVLGFNDFHLIIETT
jgi:Tfp pilus assembly protein PilF/predicted RNA methylase